MDFISGLLSNPNLVGPAVFLAAIAVISSMQRTRREVLLEILDLKLNLADRGLLDYGDIRSSDLFKKIYGRGIRDTLEVTF